MLALLYDIHGNLPALEAVLKDAASVGARRFLLGGDYALFGAFPTETVAALRSLPDASWIRGNVDRWCAHSDEAPDDQLVKEAISACREALGSQLVGALGALAEQHVSAGTLYCHASPLSDMRSFLPQPGEDDDDLLAGVNERRVVFGHTHLQFTRSRPDGIELVNPGSVGMPLDGDHRAAYALLDGDGTLALRRVAYDHERTAGETEQRFGESAWARRTAKRLRTAQP